MAAAALEGVTIHDDDVVFVGDTLYHEARLGIYSRRPGKDMAARPTYELRWQTGRAGSSSAAVSQPSFMWYRDGWHVGDEKDLGLRTSHFFLRDAATRPDLTTSMKPWQAALDGGWEDVPGVHCLAGTAGRAALVMHEEELDRRLARAASTVFLVGTPPRGGARGLDTYERRPSDLNRWPTYVLREPVAPAIRRAPGASGGTTSNGWRAPRAVTAPRAATCTAPTRRAAPSRRWAYDRRTCTCWPRAANGPGSPRPTRAASASMQARRPARWGNQVSFPSIGHARSVRRRDR